jgi:hypothetical protein
MSATETIMEKKEAKINNTGIWIFRVLVLVAVGVMLVSWFLPWWTIDLEEIGKDIVQIRPWGLVVDERMGSFDVLIKGADMPAWFAPFMWAYLACCVIAVMVGAWVRGKEVGIGKLKIKLSQFLIGGVGLSYIIAGIFAAVYISIRLKGFYNTPLQGRIYVELGDAAHTYAESSLMTGYYVIFVAGLLFLVLAIFRDKITGEKKLGA